MAVITRWCLEVSSVLLYSSVVNININLETNITGDFTHVIEPKCFLFVRSPLYKNCLNRVRQLCNLPNCNSNRNEIDETQTAQRTMFYTLQIVIR